MSSDPATNIDPAWIVGLLQAGDSFYPTGSYAHSFGLEGLVQEGVVHDRATLKAFFELSTLPALRCRSRDPPSSRRGPSRPRFHTTSGSS